MTLVQSLAELEQKLTLWCMGVEPGNDEEADRFAEAVAARNRVSQLIHRLELDRAAVAADELAVATSAIAQITQQIEMTAQEARKSRAIVDQVADALRIAAQATAVGLGL